MEEPSGSELGIFQGFTAFLDDRGIHPVPDSIKNTDVGGDRFYRVAQNIDDAGVWEFCLEALDRTRKLGGFGEKNLFRPVEVEVSLKAGAVVAHEASALSGGEIIGKARTPKSTNEREKKIDSLGDKGVDKVAIILFRLGKAHFMHPIPASKAVTLDPARDIEKKPPFLAAGQSNGLNDLLNRDAGKNSLIHENGGEGAPVFRQQFLEKGGAATGRGDNENGLPNLLATKFGIKDVVKSPTNGHNNPEANEEGEKKGHDHPASKLEGAPEIGQIKSFGGQA